MLFAEFELSHNSPVTGNVVGVEVIEQLLALTDQLQQALLSGIVLFIGLQVGGQMIYAMSKQRDLGFRGTGVLSGFSVTEFGEQLLLLFR